MADSSLRMLLPEVYALLDEWEEWDAVHATELRQALAAVEQRVTVETEWGARLQKRDPLINDALTDSDLVLNCGGDAAWARDVAQSAPMSRVSVERPVIYGPWEDSDD